MASGIEVEVLAGCYSTTSTLYSFRGASRPHHVLKRVFVAAVYICPLQVSVAGRVGNAWGFWNVFHNGIVEVDRGVPRTLIFGSPRRFRTKRVS